MPETRQQRLIMDQHLNLCSPLPYVLLGLGLMVAVTFTGLLDAAHVETGLQHYAEGRWYLEAQNRETFTLFTSVPMPANTLVNVGYVAVGIIWLVFIHREQQHQRHKSSPVFSRRDQLMFATFNWMSVCYGFVQAARLLFEQRWAGLAILDQWVTLPFFAWVVIWSLCCWWRWHGVCESRRVVTLTTFGITLVSVLSYPALVLLSPRRGFEVALAAHIAAAGAGGVSVLLSHGHSHPTQLRRTCCLALLSCSGFVCLKLLDPHLPELGPAVFSVISGHFMSKVCDVLQIHYVNRFFCQANMVRALAGAAGPSHQGERKRK